MHRAINGNKYKVVSWLRAKRNHSYLVKIICKLDFIEDLNSMNSFNFIFLAFSLILEKSFVKL